VQGHYDEMWALALHPHTAQFCSGAEDETLRVWDMAGRRMRAMAKIDGPIRCAAYSPDGLYIAIGLGGGSQKKSSKEGKWIVLESEDLELKYEPVQTRYERINDIKFSPDGKWIVVANADNELDLYAVPGHGSEQKEVRKVGVLKGHSSNVNHVDWDVTSRMLQSDCGAHELLNWMLYDDTPDGQGRWRPHQEKTTSMMCDVQWATQSCVFGWALRGIWPEDADGTDVNACARSNTGKREIVVTADDFGKVKLFRYPCIVPRAANRPYGGHSSHVTNISFTFDDKYVVSTGGDDCAVCQWEVVKER